MIKAIAKPRGGSLGPVYPKVVFNPDNPAEATVVYNIGEVNSAPEERTLILDPVKAGWGVAERILYGNSLNGPAYIFDWVQVTGGVVTSSGWTTFSGTLGNGDMVYDSTIVGKEVVTIPDMIYPLKKGIATTTSGEIFVAGEVIFSLGAL